MRWALHVSNLEAASSARPVFRANTDLMLLTTRLRMDPDGKPHVPGGLEVWKKLFVEHPNGKYDGKPTRAATGWRDADDLLGYVADVVLGYDIPDLSRESFDGSCTYAGISVPFEGEDLGFWSAGFDDALVDVARLQGAGDRDLTRWADGKVW